MKETYLQKNSFKWIAAAAVLVMLCFSFQMNVKAAAAPTNLRQTAADETSVTVEWDSVLANDINYYYRISENTAFSNPKKGYAGENESEEYLYNLTAGKTYYVQIGTSSTYSYSTIPSDVVWSQTIAVATAPKEVESKTIVQTGAKETSISLSWGASAGATGYKVKYWASREENAKEAFTDKNSITISGLEKNKEYSVAVIPVRKQGNYTAEQTAESSKSYIRVLPTKITDVDCEYFNDSVKKGNADFEWKNNDIAEGYQYEIYKYDGKKSLVKGTSTFEHLYLNTKKLKPRQIYKIRVRAYITLSDGSKKYGAWSSDEYFSRCAHEDTNLKKSGNKIKASWKKVTGASGYTIYMSNKSGSGYKKMGTTKKTSYTIKKTLKKNKHYYVRIVPNYKKGKKTYPATINDKYFYSASAWYTKDGHFYFYN